MHMQGGHLFFKNTTDPSVKIFIMHCLLAFFSSDLCLGNQYWWVNQNI